MSTEIILRCTPWIKTKDKITVVGMVRAWYMNGDAGVDKRQPHMLTPPKFVELQDLEKLGVLYHKVSRVRDFTYVIMLHITETHPYTSC